MTDFIKIDRKTGSFKGAGFAPADQVALQADEAIDVLPLLASPLVSRESDGEIQLVLDLAVVKDGVLDLIDRMGLQRIAPYVSSNPVHALKVAEAARYSRGTKAAEVPFLAAEAEALGSTIAKVRKSVLDAATEREAPAAEIEAKRIAAKQAVRDAADLADIYAAWTEWRADAPV